MKPQKYEYRVWSELYGAQNLVSTDAKGAKLAYANTSSRTGISWRDCRAVRIGKVNQ